MSDTPSQQETQAWVSLMQAGTRALDQIETALAGHSLPPLGWYDVLLEIERAGKDGLRPFVLQDRLLLAQYSMSRLLGRLEKAGYIRKIPCKNDGRGHAVQITGQGAAVRQRMWPIYAQALAGIWQGHFTQVELAGLQGLLARIAPASTGTPPKL